MPAVRAAAMPAASLSSTSSGCDRSDICDRLTACLGRRNEAAHGDYDAYTDADVKLLIAQIEAVIARLPGLAGIRSLGVDAGSRLRFWTPFGPSNPQI